MTTHRPVLAQLLPVTNSLEVRALALYRSKYAEIALGRQL